MKEQTIVSFSRRSPDVRRKRWRSLRAESLERRDLLAVGDDLLPDMLPWADVARGYMHDWYIDADSHPGEKLLRFSTAVANIGAGNLEIRGGALLPNDKQEVSQRIYLEGGGSRDVLAGTFTYHEEHNHTHFDGYARYNLRDAIPDGVGDPAVGDVVATGGKISFCLLDVDRYTTPAPVKAYSNCTATRQGITRNWADVYHADLPDQWIDVTQIAPGDYWLEVEIDPDNQLRESNDDNNVARVLVSISDTPAGEPDRFEPNNTRQTATDLGPLGDLTEANLSIHAADDDDYYAFTATLAGTLDIDVSFNHSAGDIDIELKDASGQTIESSDDTDNLEQITYQVSAGVTYYVRVFGFNGDTNPNYTLEINATGGDPVGGDRFEANDSFTEATDLGLVGDRVETGLSIHAAGNSDYYRFQLATDGQVDIGLSFTHALGDLDLTLYDAAETPILSSTGSLDEESISFPATTNEIYYLRVYGYSGAVNPSYMLSIDGPGVTVIKPDALEQNDSFATAIQLGLLGSAHYDDLTIHHEDDEDHFSFVAEANGEATVTVEFSNALGNVELDIYNDSETLIASSTSAADDGQATFAVVAGETYFVRVTGFLSSTSPNYSVTIVSPEAAARVVEVKLRRATDIADGLSIPVGGGGQLAPVANIGLDQIVVVFDKPWDVHAENLALFGVATSEYPLADGGFSTAAGESGSLVATWTLAQPLTADRLRLVVDDAATVGLTLDGEWTNPADQNGAGSEFPSGNGIAGGDFDFHFNVLPGDANQDGEVNRGDLVWLLTRGFVASGETGYSPWNDLNGDGYINVVDGIAARDRIGDSLPIEPPSPSPSAVVTARRAPRPIRSRMAADRSETNDLLASNRARDEALVRASLDEVHSARALRARGGG